VGKKAEWLTFVLGSITYLKENKEKVDKKYIAAEKR
jgi:hypothetical protein